MLLAHWRYVVEPVEVRDRLQVGLVFDQFFGPAMLQADIHHEVPDPRRTFELCGGLLLMPIAHRPSCPSGSPPLGLAFSSPGRILSIPSQGDRKSKLRNSCCRRTGS